VACGADVQGIIPEMAQADVAQEQRHSAGGAQEGPRRRKTGKGKLLTYLRSDRSKTRFSQTNQIHGQLAHVTTMVNMLLTCGPNW